MGRGGGPPWPARKKKSKKKDYLRGRAGAGKKIHERKTISEAALAAGKIPPQKKTLTGAALALGTISEAMLAEGQKSKVSEGSGSAEGSEVSDQQKSPSSCF